MSKSNGKAAPAAKLANERIASFVPTYAREQIFEDIAAWERELEEKGDIYRNGDEDDRERLNLIKASIELLDRLGSDERMRSAYADLRKLFADDDEQVRWIRLVVACQEALDDFSFERWLLDQAQWHKKEIRRASDKLWQLLESLENLAGYGLDEDWSEQRQEICHWPLEIFFAGAERKHVTGKIPRECWRGKHRLPIGRLWYSQKLGPYRSGLRAIKINDSPHYRRRHLFISPSEVVKMVHHEVGNWEPELARQSTPAEVVLASQKRSPKMRVIRAFWYCLTWQRYSRGVDWKRSAKMMRVTAQVCDVILNDPKDSVSYADVKYALNIFDKKPRENPTKRRRIRPVD